MYISYFHPMSLVPHRVFREKAQLINIPVWNENITECNPKQDQGKHDTSSNQNLKTPN